MRCGDVVNVLFVVVYLTVTILAYSRLTVMVHSEMYHQIVYRVELYVTITTFENFLIFA